MSRVSSPRLHRLVRPATGRSFVVALDHGFFAVPADLPAIADLPAVIDTIGTVAPDGVLMAAGQVRQLARLDAAGIDRPALTVRGDVTNLYLHPPTAESRLTPEIVERAVRLDAAAVLVNLLDADDNPAVKMECLAHLFAVKAAAERFGMPVMVEPIPFERRDGRYVDVADPDRLIPIVRQAVEAGADLIKAGILEGEHMRRAVDVCGGIPYLARGGSKADDRGVLAGTRHLMDSGAAGIVFGRNIFQHADPPAMAAALKAIIHDDASVDTAAKEL